MGVRARETEEQETNRDHELLLPLVPARSGVCLEPGTESSSQVFHMGSKTHVA